MQYLSAARKETKLQMIKPLKRQHVGSKRHPSSKVYVAGAAAGLVKSDYVNSTCSLVT